MFKWWHVKPDHEREQWILVPFVSVGPLSFGMSPAETAEALSPVVAEKPSQRRSRAAGGTAYKVEQEQYRQFGLSRSASLTRNSAT